MKYVFDIDNTLCLTKNSDYENSIPYPERIEKEMMNHCDTILENYIPKEKRFSCIQSSF